MRGDTVGLFESIFRRPRPEAEAGAFFKVLNGYSSVFTSAPESIYEMALIRAAIHSFASFCSKLKPVVIGSAYRELGNVLEYRPNPFMSTSQFLYRIATILSVNNNAFIVPLEDEAGYITGYYPLLPQNCEVIEFKGVVYLRYTFTNGQRAAIEFDRVGVLTQFQYDDDFFGSDNRSLRPTLQLIHAQNEGIKNGIKNSANIRFIAKIGNLLKDEDITKERNRFTADNLSSENQSGMIVYDNKFVDMKQVDSKPFVINAAQMQHINENVFNYFGTNADILQNKFDENRWNSYYEGKIEPFSLQTSLVLSNMTYTQREIARGNKIEITGNRLQYASNSTKIAMSTQLFDRGLINRNQVMDIWGFPHVKDGDSYFIRKEYAAIDNLGKEGGDNANIEGSGISGDGPTVNDGDAGDSETA